MSSDIQTWSSNGKLLITGEYLVMKGALSLALPLRKGQSLSIKKNNSKILHWQANKPDGVWFTADYELPSLNIIQTDDINLAQRLKGILVVAKQMSVDFLADNTGFDVNTALDFNPEFGFGSSSTLISNIAMWVNKDAGNRIQDAGCKKQDAGNRMQKTGSRIIDPYLLLQNTFGGSGYDIACARSNNPILYQLINNDICVTDVKFNPPEKDNLYFVYLGKKQNSSESITAFKKDGKFTSKNIDNISEITSELILTKDIAEFEKLLTEHEQIMSKVLKLPTVKSLHFGDYTGVVKSLGAWGGDFVLVTSNESGDKLRSYMLSKGFDTVFSYGSLVL